MVIVDQSINEYISVNVTTEWLDYNAVTVYNFGDVIFYGHYYYKSVVDANVGLAPDLNPREWLLWEISNRYAQIDLRATTQTTWNATTATDPADDALITDIVNKSYDILAMGNVQGKTIRVQAWDSVGGLIFDTTRGLYNRPNTNNWYNYYFGEFKDDGYSENFIFTLPPSGGGHILITVEANEGGIASVGYMVGGYSQYVGDSLFGLSVGLESNSQIEKDDFGITTITRRTSNALMDIDVIFSSRLQPEMQRVARSVLDKIVLFVGDEDTQSPYENLLILGYIDDYNAILSNSVKTTASYSIKEVI